MKSERNANLFGGDKVYCKTKVYMSRLARKPTVWTLRKVSSQISLSMPRRLIRIDTFASCVFSVSGLITLYLYPPDTECVGLDQYARTTQADLSRYITQRP